MTKTIAVDFDGVIHKYSKGWLDGSIYDEPVEGVHNALSLLKGMGFKVIIFTCRANDWDKADDDMAIAKVVDWLDQHHFYPGGHYDSITGVKPAAQYYIDDRAIRFIDWKQTLQEVT